MECPEDIRAAEKCLDCNVDNQCTKCTRGYFLDPIPNSADGGHCIGCVENCLECDARDRCRVCREGFVNYPDMCTPCDLGCAACALRPTNCTACESYYNLDSSGECYFRYSLVIVLGICVGLLLLFLVLCKLMNYILKEPGRRRKGKHREHHESILGDEYRIDPTFITDVTGIGRQTELDKNDLSLVAETQVDGHDDSIHSIKDVIPDQPQSPEKSVHK